MLVTARLMTRAKRSATSVTRWATLLATVRVVKIDASSAMSQVIQRRIARVVLTCGQRLLPGSYAIIVTKQVTWLVIVTRDVVARDVVVDLEVHATVAINLGILPVIAHLLSEPATNVEDMVILEEIAKMSALDHRNFIMNFDYS